MAVCGESDASQDLFLNEISFTFIGVSALLQPALKFGIFFNMFLAMTSKNLQIFSSIH